MEPCILKLKTTEAYNQANSDVGRVIYRHLAELQHILYNSDYANWASLAKERAQQVEQVDINLTKTLKEKGLFQTHKFNGIELNVESFTAKITDVRPELVAIEVTLISEEITVMNTLPDQRVLIAVGNKSINVTSGVAVENPKFINLNPANIASMALIKR